jgi:hypothetical protein
MATTSVKSTYSLDVETVRALEEMARRWGVSKSEALRRAIRAAKHGSKPAKPDALAALGELQRSVKLDRRAASRWTERVRAERRASSIRREQG